MPGSRAQRPGRHRHHAGRQNSGGSEHRRRRPADPDRHADLRAAAGLHAPGGCGHTHGRHRGRAGRASTRARSPTTMHSPASCWLRPKPKARRCGACRVDEEYKEALEERLRRSSKHRRPSGGSVTAAMFLRDFVGDTPWVHLDIAGHGMAGRRQALYGEGRHRHRRADVSFNWPKAGRSWATARSRRANVTQSSARTPPALQLAAFSGDWIASSPRCRRCWRRQSDSSTTGFAAAARCCRVRPA